MDNETCKPRQVKCFKFLLKQNKTKKKNIEFPMGFSLLFFNILKNGQLNAKLLIVIYLIIYEQTKENAQAEKIHSSFFISNCEQMLFH